MCRAKFSLGEHNSRYFRPADIFQIIWPNSDADTCIHMFPLIAWKHQVFSVVEIIYYNSYHDADAGGQSFSKCTHSLGNIRILSQQLVYVINCWTHDVSYFTLKFVLRVSPVAGILCQQVTFLHTTVMSKVDF